MSFFGKLCIINNIVIILKPFGVDKSHDKSVIVYEIYCEIQDMQECYSHLRYYSILLWLKL